MVGVLIGAVVAIAVLVLTGRSLIPQPPAPAPWIIGGGGDPVGEDPLPGGHNEWDNQVRYACLLYGMTDPLAPVFMKAVIQRESGWNVRARGDYDPGRCPSAYRGDAFYAGYCSIGLMQVHRGFHPELAAAYDLRDGAEAILAGGQILAGAYRAWWPDWQRVYAQYNAGAGAAAAWPAVTEQVRRNVEAVGRIYRGYAAAIGVAV